MINRVLLKVKSFAQIDQECAVAAAASIANYYNKKIDYASVREMLPARTRKYGLYSSEEARLLNMLGFKNVSIITSDTDIVDYSWAKLSKKRLLKKLKEMLSYTKRIQDAHREEIVADLIYWLQCPEYNNQLVIDNDFAKHIRNSLNSGHPIGVSVNATSMYQMQKAPRLGDSDIKGQHEEHALVARGYDDKGVFLVDSGRLYSDKKYYKVNWEKLLVNIPQGDLIAVDGE